MKQKVTDHDNNNRVYHNKGWPGFYDVEPVSLWVKIPVILICVGMFIDLIIRTINS